MSPEANPPDGVPDPIAPSPPKNKPVLDPPEPLTESEAKEFIKKEVDARLWERTKWVAAGLGVTTLVGLWGIYLTVQGAVKETATQEAKQYAEATLAPLSKTMNEAFTQSLKDFVKAYGDLEKTKNSLDNQVNASQESIKKLEDSIQELNKSVTTDSAGLPAILAATEKATADIKTLQETLSNIKNLDTTKLATVLSELSKGDPTLLPKLDNIFSELQGTYTYGIKAIDSDPFELASQTAWDKLVNGASFNELLDKHSLSADALAKIDQFVTGSPDFAVGGFGRSLIGYEVKLPLGSEMVATWGVPYNGLVARKYVCDAKKSDPTSIGVTFSSKEKDVGEVKVYILYRTPVHGK